MRRSPLPRDVILASQLGGDSACDTRPHVPGFGDTVPIVSGIRDAGSVLGVAASGIVTCARVHAVS